MSWNEVFQTALAVIASVGGSAVIIGAFSSYLGKIWADKYIESIRTKNQKEIDDYKSQLDTKAQQNLETIKNAHQKQLENYKSQLDLFKENSLRYSGQQFQLYNKLWHTLYDLKLKADLLWDTASPTNLKSFSKQLKDTIDEVEKSFLFIEDNHYLRLKELLEQFSTYRLGKKELIEIRSMTNTSSISPNDIATLISGNEGLKRDYEMLIENIRNEFKRQIRGV